MLTKLHIINFQSHKDLTVEFTNGFNCIVGTTNIGKSAIVRSLRWLLFNDRFKDFISHGENFCEVTAWFDNGVILKKYQKGTTRRYTLTVQGIPLEFNNFGDSVPLEIQRAIGYKDFILDDKESINLNVKSQHDPLFLLTKSGSYRAKALNALVNMNLIDLAMKNLGVDNKRLTKEQEDLQNELQQLKIDLKSFSNLESREHLLNELKGLNDKLKVLQGDLTKFTTVLKGIEDYKLRKSLWKSKNEVYKSIDISKVDEFEKLFETSKKFTEVLNKINEYTFRKSKVKDKKSSAENTLNVSKKSLLSCIIEMKKCPVCTSDIDENLVNKIMESL